MALLSSLILSATATASVTILFDGGGLVHEYQQAAKNALEQNIQIKIDGRCYSACTILADQARPNVCITPNARFFIHQATNHPSGTRTPVEYSPDLDAFIGAQPLKGWKILEYRDLIKFWRACK